MRRPTVAHRCAGGAGTLGRRHECALKSVQRYRAQLIKREIELLGCVDVLVGESRPAHEAIVGIEHHVRARVEIAPERVRFV